MSECGCDLQDSEVFETREVCLGDDCQVVSIQITAKQTGQQQIREQEANREQKSISGP